MHNGKIFSLVATVFIIGAVSCRHPDYEISLSSGYNLVKGNDQDIFILDKNGNIVIGGKVARYAVIDNAIIGYVELPDWKSKEEWLDFNVIEGYFHINLISGDVALGMSIQDIEKIANNGFEMVNVE